MENNIQLNGNNSNNAYIRHFTVAQFNLHLLIREEPRYRRRYNPRYTSPRVSTKPA